MGGAAGFRHNKGRPLYGGRPDAYLQFRMVLLYQIAILFQELFYTGGLHLCTAHSLGYLERILVLPKPAGHSE